MAGTRISDMTTTTALSSASYVPIAYAGDNYKYDLSTFAPRGFYTLEQFGGVADADPTAGTGTLNDTAWDDAFTAMDAAGGGCLLLSGWYRLTTSKVLPRGSVVANNIKKQNSFKIIGTGNYSEGEGTGIKNTGSGLMWTNSSGVGRLVAKGLGQLTVSDFTMMSYEGTTAGSGRPFLYITNTTLARERVSFFTRKTGANCDDDAVVYGGTSTTLGDGDDAPFQGYGSYGSGCFFQGIRRAVYWRTYANSIPEFGGFVGHLCGSNLGVGLRAPYEMNPNVSGSLPAETCTGNSLIGIGYEIGDAYDYGCILTQSVQTDFYSFHAFDDAGQAVAGIKQTATASATTITGGRAPAGKPMLEDVGLNKSWSLQSAEDGVLSRFRGVYAGESASPNSFGQTFFRAGNNATVVQPTTAASSSLDFRMRRAADEGTAANTDYFLPDKFSGLTLGNSTYGGTLSITDSTGTNRVVTQRQSAVANAVNAVGVPTNAEFNALVTQFNALCGRLRNHGLIAP